ncbi:MAG: hypothetical protein JJU12_00815 [Chlamydiales bacterium]|nr:hypothetical protein [Chlamydiales bacterium]
MTIRLYLEDLIDACFWKAVEEKLEDVQAIFQALEQFLVKETQTTPLKTLRKEHGKVPAPQAVEQLKQDVFGPLEKFCRENPSSARLFDLRKMKEEFDAFVDYKKLPKEISIYGMEEGISIVEATADMTSEGKTIQDIADMELENENLSDKTSDLPTVRYDPADPLPWNGDYLQLLANSSPRHTLLGIPVYYSPNFARVSEFEDENARVQKPAYQILVHENLNGEMRVVLLDLHDARAILRNMSKGVVSSNANHYYLMSGGGVIACDSKRRRIKLDETNTQTTAIHLIRKLYSAHTTLTKKEKQYLAERDHKAFFNELNRLHAIWPHLTSFAAQSKLG